MGSEKPGNKGGKILQEYCAKPVKDVVLIVSSAKVETASQKTKWFKAIEKAGLVVAIYPIASEQLPRWLQQRLQNNDLQTDNVGINLLAAHTEGNLLAASQEIEKLRLIYGEGKISGQEIAKAIANNARFDIFQLVDTAMLGDPAKALRILRGLRAEGTEAILTLWALTREIRSLINMATLVEQGSNIQQAIYQARVWEKRKPMVSQALQRCRLKKLLTLLKHASVVDQMIKGAIKGNPWDELDKITLRLAS